MTPKNNVHTEVVTGIVRVIRHIADKRRDGHNSFSLGELFEIGSKGISEEAQMYICEFVKDGVVNLQQRNIDEVLGGNYDRI